VIIGGSTAGAGTDDRRRALGVSLEMLQQLTGAVSLFDGQVVEQQFPDTA
jgi:hypothetical protein